VRARGAAASERVLSIVRGPIRSITLIDVLSNLGRQPRNIIVLCSVFVPGGFMFLYNYKTLPNMTDVLSGQGAQSDVLSTFRSPPPELSILTHVGPHLCEGVRSGCLRARPLIGSLVLTYVRPHLCEGERSGCLRARPLVRPRSFPVDSLD
jgi:hypothetical protein